MPASIALREGLPGSLGNQWNRAGGGEPTLGDARWRRELAAGSPSHAKGGRTDPVAQPAGLGQWTGSAGDRFGERSQLGNDPVGAGRYAKPSGEPSGGGQSTLAVGRLVSAGNLAGGGFSRDLCRLASGQSNRRVAAAPLDDNRPGSPLAGVAAPWQNQPSPALVRLASPRLADQRRGMDAHLSGVSANPLNSTQGFATNANTSSTRMRRMMINSSIWL